MKTEQEQIEQIEKVLKDSVTDYKHLKKKGVCYCYAETLIDNGYGDVSEYKAEIERLKAENNELNKKNWSLEEELKKKELEITYARNNGYEKGYDECEEYMKDKIKQAQIDMLNKAKKCSHCDNFFKDGKWHRYVFVKDIDELIKEVEDANSK